MQANDATRDESSMYANRRSAPGLAPAGAITFPGSGVHDKDGEDLGDIDEFMNDRSAGKAEQSAIWFGGLPHPGDTLVAVPWAALTLDTASRRFTLDVLQGALKDAAGFNKDRWPSMSDRTWSSGAHRFNGTLCSTSEPWRHAAAMLTLQLQLTVKS